jgi:hypothetical protein
MRFSVKVKVYKTTVNPAVVFGCETWSVAEMDIKRLSVWERTINGPVVKQGMWRVKTDEELRKLYKDLDIVADVRKNREGGLGL